MMSNAMVCALTNCQVYFALKGSDFDREGERVMALISFISGFST